MKILIVSTTSRGHLNPLLGIARILIRHGHAFLVQTGKAMKSIADAAGLPFIPFVPEAGMEAPEYPTKYPELHEKTSGMEMFGFDMEHTGHVAKTEYSLGDLERELEQLMNQVATSRPITEPNQLVDEPGTKEWAQLNIAPKPDRRDPDAAIRKQEVTVWWLLGVMGVLIVISFCVLWHKANGG